MHASMERAHVPGSGKVHIAHRSRRFGRLILITSGLLTWTALPLVAHAQGSAFLVKDINTVQSSSYPTDLTGFDAKIFFSVADIHAGPGLWRSDGTAEGTALIKADAVSSPTPTESALFFLVESDSEQELWSISRSETAVRLKTISPVFGFGQLTAVRGTLFFVVHEPLPELWKTDGTVAGTVPLTRFQQVQHVTSLNNTLFFFAVSNDQGLELWKSDGTVAGTVRLRNFGYPVDPQEFTEVDGTLFFTGEVSGGRGLWRSDGTVSGTAHVDTFYHLQDLANVNGTLFFVADDGTHGEDIWKSDGTAAGIMRVTDFRAACPLNCSAQGPRGLTAANGTLFFAADVSFAGNEGGQGARAGLWRSDGTAAGTRLVRGPFVAVYSLVHIGGTLYFLADDGATGIELWRSDGSEAGTALVKDIHLGPASSMPSDLIDVDGTLFFVADDGSAGREIWKSDGTETGTARVADILHDSYGSNPTQLTDVNGTLLFVAYDGHTGAELWRSDGTAPGTRLVKEINPTGDAFNPFFLASQAAEVNGTLFFSANDGSSGAELWRSDGSESGTVLVQDINPGDAGSTPLNFTHAAGTLYFWADDGSHGLELWKSDGTPAGTGLVRDINPGSPPSIMPRCSWGEDGGGCEPEVEPTEVNGTLFFRAYDEDTGFELWKTDGTAAGTVRVKDTNPGVSPSYPDQLTNVDGTLFFTAYDGSTGYDIWKSDGTEVGTVRVTETLENYRSPFDLTAVNGTLFFAWNTDGGARELWRSDGTTAGTVPVQHPGPQVIDMTSFEGTVAFIGIDASGGTQLWRSDGTAAGTVLVKRLPGYLYGALTEIDGTLLFSVGGEIWRSDGTEAGTGAIQGFGAPYPLESFTLAGEHVFFSADGFGSGPELWALPLATSCRGDCSGDGVVTVNDLIAGVSIALDRAPLGACQSLDANGDGRVTVDELIAAVNEALNGCG